MINCSFACNQENLQKFEISSLINHRANQRNRTLSCLNRVPISRGSIFLSRFKVRLQTSFLIDLIFANNLGNRTFLAKVRRLLRTHFRAPFLATHRRRWRTRGCRTRVATLLDFLQSFLHIFHFSQNPHARLRNALNFF